MTTKNNQSAEFTLLARYVLRTERRLQTLRENFENRPELQQIEELKSTLAKIEERLSQKTSEETVPTEIDQSFQSDEVAKEPIEYESQYQLIFDRTGSREILLEALSATQERLVIVCPWLSRNSLDADLLQNFTDCLNRGCRIEIGWGYSGDRSKIGKGWRYSALANLKQLETVYTERFKLKMIGTHEKYLVCDRSFALVGSHNVLTSGTQSAEKEVGIRTTDPKIIEGLLARFDNVAGLEQEELPISDDIDEVSEIVELSHEYASAEALNGEPNTNGEEPEEISNLEEGIGAEEFLKRYNSGEKDFTGVDLTKVDLTEQSLANRTLNLSKANLMKAKLARTELNGVNLSEANLRYTILTEAQLYQTNLSGANLENADLQRVSLRQAKLNKASLRKASLHQVDFRKEKLVDVDLRGASMYRANLLEANLENTYLQGAKLN